MSAERKLLIATGATIIAAMIAVAFFSLGVYVGEQGWTLSPPSPAGPVPRQGRPGGPPNRGRPAVLPGVMRPPQVGQRPPLVGVVRRVENHSLTLQAGRETRTVALDGRTRYERRTADGQIEQMERELLQPDAPVVIFVRDGHPPVAERVILMPRR